MRLPHLFHRWTPWKYYAQKITIPPSGFRDFDYTFTLHRRKRQCLVCGLEQFQHEELRPNRPWGSWVDCGGGELRVVSRGSVTIHK